MSQCDWELIRELRKAGLYEEARRLEEECYRQYAKPTAIITVAGIASADPSEAIVNAINSFYRNIESYRWITEIETYYPSLYEWISKAKPFVEKREIRWGQLGYFELDLTLYETLSPFPTFLAVILGALLVGIPLGIFLIILWVQVKNLAGAVQQTAQATYTNTNTLDQIVDTLYANKMITSEQYEKLKADIEEARKGAKSAEETARNVQNVLTTPTPTIPKEFMDIIWLILIVAIVISVLGLLRR